MLQIELLIFSIKHAPPGTFHLSWWKFLPSKWSQDLEPSLAHLFLKPQSNLPGKPVGSTLKIPVESVASLSHLTFLCPLLPPHPCHHRRPPSSLWQLPTRSPCSSTCPFGLFWQNGRVIVLKGKPSESCHYSAQNPSVAPGFSQRKSPTPQPDCKVLHDFLPFPLWSHFPLLPPILCTPLQPHLCLLLPWT